MHSGRSSALSNNPPASNLADIEPYAQAVVPRHRRAQAAEPTYAVASRTSPSRKESITMDIPDGLEGSLVENGEDSAPPVPPKLFDSDNEDDAEDDDSSDDGEETKDTLDDTLGSPTRNGRLVHIADTMTPSSYDTSNGHIASSTAAGSTTFDASDFAEEKIAFF